MSRRTNEADLRKYVIAHPGDEDAFQSYLSIMRAKPGVLVDNADEFEAELRKRLNISGDQNG